MDWIQVVVLGTMISILITRSIKEVKDGQKWNWVRQIVILAIFSNFMEHFLRILHYEFGLLNTLFNLPISIVHIFSRCIIVFGLMFVAYINGWKTLLLLPAFYLTGAIIFKITTGINGPFEYFFDYGGIIALILIFKPKV